MDCIDLQNEIKRDLRRFFSRILDRRPVIHPIVVDV
jgi:ribonuclease J